MSLGSGFLENLPHFTFTPTEHQVECVRVAADRNLTFVTTQPHEKSFLVLMLVREVANTVRGRLGKAALLVYQPEQVGLWASFLTRMTDLKVSGLPDSEALDTGQIVETAGVLVTTHSTLNTLLARKHTELASFCLVIVDNIQASLQTNTSTTFLSQYSSLARNQAPRLIGITPNILTSNSDLTLDSLPHQLARLQSLLPSSVECACEVATQLRYLARPRESVLLFSSLVQEECRLEMEVRGRLSRVREWILDQNYSLYDTYGEEFGDLIADIPDPALIPLQIIKDFEDILGELGVWCADRAALILMIKIDKLKTREKYERHFLLLSVLFSVMVSIRKVCDDTFGDQGEVARLEQYSRPKLGRLVQLLMTYSPPMRIGDKAEAEQPAIQQQGTRRRGAGRRTGSVPENPDNLCALVVVSTAFSAKIIYHYLKELSKCRTELSFLCPQYAVQDALSQDPRDAENERKKQEEALRRFRMRECNVLVSSSVLEEGIDFVKCNLVVLFDHPNSFHRYVYTKVKCKSVGGSLIHVTSEQEHLTRDLKRFHALEHCLVTNCKERVADCTEDKAADEYISLIPGYPNDITPSPLTLNNSILVLNRYCAKLPSDTFTRLTPSWTVEPVSEGFYCALYLPINSPLKALVVGQVMPSPALARRSAAFSVCVQLHQAGELDDNMMPLGKESVLPQLFKVEWSPEDAVRPGTTKRRQYYYKRVADCLTRTETENSDFVEDVIDTANESVVRGNIIDTAICEDGGGSNDTAKCDGGETLENTSSPTDCDKSICAANIVDEDIMPNTANSNEEESTLCTSNVNVGNVILENINNANVMETEVVTIDHNNADSEDQIFTETGIRLSKVTITDCQHESKETTAKTEPCINDIKNVGENNFNKFYESDKDPLLEARFSNIQLPCSMVYSLYCLKMSLTCPIPEEQNTRGRKIHDPQLSSQLFGLLLPHQMPAVPAFPIYTRSGEVLVTVELVMKELTFTPEQLRDLATFHMFTFSSVLRLEKYPMVFSATSSHNGVVVVPLLASQPGPIIDWKFLSTISGLATRRLRTLPDKERDGFSFVPSDYSDAVIMPWYRNQDQPQYFYVAEICTHLSPASDFPGQGFETFSLYYSTKYGINIQNSDQPLLDVDHTSARLNFLTPRYVNRKGIALPTSSEETKRNKRENLDQKQILVPELCAIHPFPASLWRQTVSLPCTLYRLNGLLIADQIRRDVSREMRLGLPTVSEEFSWPALNFGWTLADVVNSSKVEGSPASEAEERKKKAERRAAGSNTEEEMGEFGEWTDDWAEEEDMDRVAEKLLSKLAEEERLTRKKKLEIGTWSNEMASSSDQKVPGLDGVGLDWGKEEGANDEELDMEGIELPDNLTFINPKGVGGVDMSAEGKKDWGTGIQAKNFRVGSPTMYMDGGRDHMSGLMNDLEGFSCSDSEDSWAEDDFSDTEVEREGGARIEFHGENVAEAIEAEEESQAREERVAKDRDQEASMVAGVDWDPSSLLEEAHEDEIEWPELKVNIVQETDTVLVSKPSELIKTSQPKSGQPPPSFSPFCPLSRSLVDQDTVLRHLSLLPDLDLVRPGPKEDWGVIPWPGIDPDSQFSFDEQPKLLSHPGPSPSLILQALTMSNSNDAINLERLETIGDSFLKYAITSYLFCQHPHIHEGKLSHLRSKQVSNLNLYQLGQARGLGEAMIATKFEPHDNWLPPCYHVPRELEQALIESGVPASHWNMADLPSVESLSSQQICELLRERAQALAGDTDTDIQDMPSFVPYNLLTQHSIPDKSIADCVEALIGAYLIACGPRGALLFMTWLGVTVLPPHEAGQDQPPNLSPPPSPLLDTPHLTQQDRHLLYLLDGYQKFEHMVGYVWQDKSYLLQAFSHASYYPNRLTDCYQRLEFLGDAVLDYLITRHLYQDPRLHSPGALTDLRSALVNNTIFACLAVRHQFHKFFKHLSPGLQKVCDRFVRIQAENGWKVSEECYLIEEEETEEAEDIEVPKALGDIFESVAGSIFLDSGLSLDAVWRVYYRMMKDEIDQFSSHVPKSPIRELLELEPETAKFGKPEKLADGRRVRVSVEVFGKGVFKGIGRNYRIAKCTAAKCALKALKKMDHKKRNHPSTR